MNEDLLDYDLLIADALRGVVRSALAIAAEHGLPDGHHFHITFLTDHPGVEIPADLRAQYPEEMTIVLQHMFWDLDVGPEGFGVTLAFNSVHRRLIVPFEAVSIFQDQSVGFVLQFQGRDESETPADTESGQAGDKQQKARERLAARMREAAAAAESREETADAGDGRDSKSEVGDKGDNVVPLDTFRKN